MSKEWEEETRKPHKDFHLLQLRKNITLKTSSHFFFLTLPFPVVMIFARLKNENVTFHTFERMLLISTNFLKKQVIRISVSKHFY